MEGRNEMQVIERDNCSPYERCFVNVCCVRWHESLAGSLDQQL